MDEASQKHSGDLDEDERFWSSEDEGVKDVDAGNAGVGATAGETEAVTGVGTKVGGTKVHGEGSNTHRVYNSKCGSKQLIPMDAILAKNIVTMSEGKLVRVRALPDLGSSASIISLELAVKLGLEREDPGLTKLEDASGSRMDVTAVASVAVRELSGIPSYFQVLVSRDLGEDDMVVGIDELKTLHILHADFPRTLPEYRRAYMGNHVCLHMPVQKDEERECDKERASRVLLYLEDRYEFEDTRIKPQYSNFRVAKSYALDAVPYAWTSCLWKLRPCKKVHNRRQSPDQAAKSTRGKKVDYRFQSPEQAGKLRTGEKVNNKQESQQQA